MTTGENPALEPGRTFASKYRVERLIGKGGFGAVYEVRNELGWRQAIKVLHPEIGENPVYRKRFLREMHIARDLLHENAVAVRDAGESDGSLYYTMDYVDGRTVASEIKARGKIEPLRAIDWGLQVLSFLEFLNGKGFLHRDLKPANLMVEVDSNGEERLRVLDLGIARSLVDDTSIEGHTMLTGGMIVGTPVYMAPEHIAGDEVDERIDFYALGVILYECLSGRKPFGGTTVQRLYHAIHTETPPSLPELIPGFSPEIWKVIEKAIAKDRDERYESTASFRNALLACRPSDTDGDDWDPTIMNTVAAPVKKMAKSGGRGIGLLVLVILLVAGAGVGVWLNRESLGLTGGDPNNQTGGSGGGLAVALTVVSPKEGVPYGTAPEFVFTVENGVEPIEAAVTIDGADPVPLKLAKRGGQFVASSPLRVNDGQDLHPKVVLRITDANGKSDEVALIVHLDRAEPDFSVSLEEGQKILRSDQPFAVSITTKKIAARAHIGEKAFTPSSTKITSNIDVSTVGRFPITFMVEDAAKNMKPITKYIEVVTEIAPPKPLAPELTVLEPTNGSRLTVDEIIVEVEVRGQGKLIVNGEPAEIDRLTTSSRSGRARVKVPVAGSDNVERTITVEFRPADGQPAPAAVVRTVQVDNVQPKMFGLPLEKPFDDNTVELVVDATEILAAGTTFDKKAVTIKGKKAFGEVSIGATVSVHLVDQFGNTSTTEYTIKSRKPADFALPEGFEAVGDAADDQGRPKRIRRKGTSIELTLVPASGPDGFELEDFLVEEKRTRVVAKPFYIGVTEVTVAQLAASGIDFFVDKDDFLVDRNVCDVTHPVVNIHWSQASQFCKRLGMTLPTEAQWEWTCRVETQARFGRLTNYLWGDDYGDAKTDRAANVDGSDGRDRWRYTTSPAGSFDATKELGVHDLTGNVWEWCRDVSPSKANRGAHMIRGGSYLDGKKGTPILRRLDKNGKSRDIGFRVCLEVE